MIRLAVVGHGHASGEAHSSRTYGGAHCTEPRGVLKAVLSRPERYGLPFSGKLKGVFQLLGVGELAAI